jgi:phenylacetate-CoA ligase
VEFGTRYGTLLGRVIVPLDRKDPPYWRRNYAWNQVLYSSFHLNAATARIYADAMQTSGIEALEAYPSTAYILALGLRNAGIQVPLRAVFTSSEPLLEMQRELVEERFSCRVFDFYGMSEAIMFAGECNAHSGLHHHMELSIVEVLDAKGFPVQDGETGRLVGTTLHNDAMPLIRYDIGDLTARIPARCPCGRAHVLHAPVTTKAEDIVVTPDGRLISPSVLTHPLKPLKGLEMSQIIQDAPDRVRVLLVVQGEASTKLLEQVREGMGARLGPEVRVELEIVDRIPLSANGKFRWVISNVPLGEKLLGSGNLYSAVSVDSSPSGVPSNSDTPHGRND